MSRLGLPGARCLGADLTAYADRVMDTASLLKWDRHVVACTCCRAAVDEERRVLASLRSPSAPGVPGDLRGMLLAMANDPGAAGAAPPGHALADRSARAAWSLPMVPPVPTAPVPVVDRGAPAMHRSARRATVFAGLAAGATAAAAWSLVVTGGSLTSPTPTSVTPGTVQRARPAPGFATAAFTVPVLGTRTPATPPRSTQPTRSAPDVGAARLGSAQSTP
ncbi:hypothetical protein GCM10009867_12540 [Pedococcus aerophilus]|uniref:Zinc-finger domain-containing protein n=2 Tax=Pedococcus aerophilus TaxID=436356 RepID=A0ABP6H088_9MICO